VKIAVVGAGRVATALAVGWLAAGHEISVARHGEGTERRHRDFLPQSPLTDADTACARADVVVLGVPDDLITQVCEEVVAHVPRGARMLHLSGATGLDALAAAKEVGIGVLSIHPLQTFPTVEAALATVPGVPMAVTAQEEESYELGERLSRDAGGEPFRLPDEAKPLYHAAAVFASNYLIAVMAQAEELFAAAGLQEPLTSFMPLARASIDNVELLGPANALTGPVVRGDGRTVRRNLEALAVDAPEAVDAYVSLARMLLGMAWRTGRIDAEARAGVEEVLSQWNG